MSGSTTDRVEAPAIVATLVITAGIYVDRGLQTASWTDTHELQTGEYPLTLCNVGGGPTPNATRPYYARASVPTLLVEEYRVSRLLWASSAHTTRPNRADTVSVCLYGYALRDGLTVLDGHGTVRVVRDHPDRHRLGFRTPDGSIWWKTDDAIDQVSGTCGCGSWVTALAAPDVVQARFAAEHTGPLTTAVGTADSGTAH